MFGKLVGSLVVMSVCIGLVTAEEFTARISKVEGKNVTYTKFSFGKGKKGKKDKKDAPPEATTLPVAKKATIAKGKFSFDKEAKKANYEVGDAIEGGLKNEIFTKIDEKKGVFARITTSDDNKTITKILVLDFGKGKGKKKKADQ